MTRLVLSSVRQPWAAQGLELLCKGALPFSGGGKDLQARIQSQVSLIQIYNLRASDPRCPCL